MIEAFIGKGLTYLIPSAATAPSGVQVVPDSRFDRGSVCDYRIYNSGSVTAFVGVGSSASEAQSNAVAATAGSPAKGIAIGPGAVEILRFNDSAYFSSYSTANSDVYIVVGEGI